MQKNTGIRRIIKASIYSYKGLVHAATKEAAFRQELIAALVLVPLACFLPVTSVERVVLVGAVVLVLVVELLNTAVEATVDRIGSEFHELAGLAKDLGSAAVLLSLLFCIFAWGAILWPYIVR